MIENCVLIHRPKPKSNKIAGPGFILNTCLRSIWVGDRHLASQIEVHSTDEIYKGFDALHFLVQVTCGLQSPLIGETEVFGQFKSVLNETTVLPSSGFFQKVTEVTKKVRHNHLRHLGSSSYGSICRRELSDQARVSLIGAGQLAEEILPWLLKDGREIRVYCRTPERREPRDNVTYHRLSDLDRHSGALIIAAPVSADQVGAVDGFSRVIDLRENSAEDPIGGTNLDQFFASLREQRLKAEQIKLNALRQIDQLLNEMKKGVYHRPMGWEDLCVS